MTYANSFPISRAAGRGFYPVAALLGLLGVVAVLTVSALIAPETAAPALTDWHGNVARSPSAN